MNFCWLWCRRMWMLLQVHAKQCQRSDCPVPRCKELREMRRRAVVRQEDQRRVAYKNMVRCCALSFPCSLWLLWHVMNDIHMAPCVAAISMCRLAACKVAFTLPQTLQYRLKSRTGSRGPTCNVCCCSCGSRTLQTSRAARRAAGCPAMAQSPSTSPSTERGAASPPAAQPKAGAASTQQQRVLSMSGATASVKAEILAVRAWQRCSRASFGVCMSATARAALGVRGGTCPVYLCSGESVSVSALLGAHCPGTSRSRGAATGLHRACW